MGQYYKPCILAPKEKPNSPEIIEAWCYSHDYDNGLKLMEHSYVGNNFVNAFSTLIQDKPARVVWAGDYAESESNRDENIYHLCTDDNKALPSDIIKDRKPKYVINHDKKQFVDNSKSEPDDYDLCIHALPLLTAEGNGQGGGDYWGDNPLVGTWARDLISVSTRKPKGYEEIIPAFKE